MIIFRECGTLQCGINNDGELFLGDDRTGYNLPDTPENRAYIIEDFETNAGWYRTDLTSNAE